MKVTKSKKSLLKKLYQIAPFDISGNSTLQPCKEVNKIFSILICASRSTELDQLLFDLSLQTFHKKDIEIIILNDGSEGPMDQIIENYKNKLPIIYTKNNQPCRIIGQLRNQTIAMSSGNYLLFLDDDARIFQKDFLDKAYQLFKDEQLDGIMPQGKSLYGLVKQKFDYIDQYSYATRCCLYKRTTLEQIGGFNAKLQSYEDIELSIRLNILGTNMLQTDELTYFHPPLYFDSMRKPLSIGQSILKIKENYSFLLWFAVYVNAIRFIPLILIPKQKYQQWAKISFGVFLGPMMKGKYYY